MGLRVYHEDYPTCVSRDQFKANDLHIFDQEDLEHLANVEIAGPANLHIVYYDSAAGKWKSRLLSSWALSELGTKVLNNLNNVNVPAPTDQYVLKYSSGSGLWIASPVPLHKDRHDPNDGADKLDTAAAGAIQPDDSAAVGSAHSFARSDHKHAIVTDGPADVGVANAEGGATSFSRSDHVHDVAGQAGEGHINFLPMSYVSIGQGVWAFWPDADMWSGFAWGNSSSADGDELDYKAYLAQGTYTFMIQTYKFPEAGILKVDIDGEEVASIDLYNVGWVRNVREVVADIAVATSGLKTITLRVDGKNASSTDYYIVYSYAAFWRTA